MALVKKSDLAAIGPRRPASPPADLAGAAQRRASQRSRARREKAAERLGAATEQFASGVAEAAAAAEQLRRALEQIAAASEEAAGAAHESQASIESLGAIFARSRTHATHTVRAAESLQTALAESAGQIESLVASVLAGAERQKRFVGIVASLEGQAAGIGDITGALTDIAEQTSLLALNAALEAARAGDNGRGFAVVADEVRAFAEITERRAAEVKGLTSGIAAEIRTIAARTKAEAERAGIAAADGRSVIAILNAIRTAIDTIAAGAQQILQALEESEAGAREAQAGAGQVAAAAEQQAAATVEAQRAVQQQSDALEQSQRTAVSLARLAEGWLADKSETGSAAEVAAAAEQLSATVQELSGAAGEILNALDQISRGAHSQASATHQSATAMAQIQKAASATQAASATSFDRAAALADQLVANRSAVASLGQSFVDSRDQAGAVLLIVDSLEASSWSIEKINDQIAMIAVQTNMLAVTGAVEAARTGESGRGFAVVSADIRVLSRDSAENADRIKQSVRLAQAQIAAVRRTLEDIASAAQTELGRQAGLEARLDAASAGMDAIKAGSADILSGAQEVVAALGQVLAGTQQIAAAAEESSGAAAEAATAARQQASGAEDLAAAIEEIASLADELQIAEV
jgi:methyl-accepting chemotaxis protein